MLEGVRMGEVGAMCGAGWYLYFILGKRRVSA